MRKRQAKKRPLLPDPRFNDQLVTRFVNMMMWDGKKSVAFKIFYDAIDIVEEKKTDHPMLPTKAIIIIPTIILTTIPSKLLRIP